MRTPSDTYYVPIDTEIRLESLKAAYADRPEARRNIDRIRPAKAFINATSQFKATLLMAVTHNQGTPLMIAFGDAAIDRSDNECSLKAQMAIAGNRPEVNTAMVTMLEAHKAYVDAKPVPLGRRLIGYVSNLVR